MFAPRRIRAGGPSPAGAVSRGVGTSLKRSTRSGAAHTFPRSTCAPRGSLARGLHSGSAWRPGTPSAEAVASPGARSLPRTRLCRRPPPPAQRGGSTSRPSAAPGGSHPAGGWIPDPTPAPDYPHQERRPVGEQSNAYRILLRYDRKSRHRRIKKQRRYERLAATSQFGITPPVTVGQDHDCTGTLP